jgi:hypothetical protein
MVPKPTICNGTQSKNNSTNKTNKIIFFVSERNPDTHFNLNRPYLILQLQGQMMQHLAQQHLRAFLRRVTLGGIQVAMWVMWVAYPSCIMNV